METVKLSSKGQIVIPKAIREAHHFETGAEFLIVDDGNGLRLVPAKSGKRTTLEQVAGCLYRPGRKPMTDDDMNAAIRARAKANDDATKTGRK